MHIRKIIALIISIMICASIAVFTKEYKSLQTIVSNNVEINNTMKLEAYDKIPDIYYDFLKTFDTHGKEYYYSFIKLEDFEYPILALSDAVYQDETKSYVALGTSIYYYGQGNVIYFGDLYSDGTAYPIRADKTGIFTAGGHRMAKYNLDVKKQILYLIESCKVYFNTKGEATYIIIEDSNHILINSEEFEEEYEKYTDAQVVYFIKLLINENQTGF